MKKDDKIVCIDNFGANDLIVGETYTIRDIYQYMVWLKEKSGFEENGFRIDRFEKKIIYDRKQKMKKIYK